MFHSCFLQPWLIEPSSLERATNPGYIIYFYRMVENEKDVSRPQVRIRNDHEHAKLPREHRAEIYSGFFTSWTIVPIIYYLAPYNHSTYNKRFSTFYTTFKACTPLNPNEKPVVMLCRSLVPAQPLSSAVGFPLD